MQSDAIKPIERPRVAVIGLGIAGLAALKNLREIGFDAVGFEQDDHVGGLWAWNARPDRTSVLRVTKSNSTKQFSCYTDYPFPKETPIYPSSEDVASYLQSYAEHFDILKHARLGRSIERISLASSGRWAVTHTAAHADPISDSDPASKSNGDKPIGSNSEGGNRTDSQTDEFDRVLVATGPFCKPQIPNVPGRDAFQGTVIHSQSYKLPEEFAGKRVVVVGIGNTACDVAVDLCGTAKQVYLSHRSGVRLVQRWVRGRPADHLITRRRTALATRLNNLFPALAAFLISHLVVWMMKRRHNLDPSWGLTPVPKSIQSGGTLNDHIIDRLTDGAVISLPDIRKFTPTGIITDRGELEVDAVIFATGSAFDYSIFSEDSDPTKPVRAEWEAHPNADKLPFPWLYQAHFHIEHPDSLAFIGPCRGFSVAATSNADLSSQAIAQVWAGRFALPPKTEMQRWCEDNYKLNYKLLRDGRLPKTAVDIVRYERWLNDAAGSGINEHLGWGWTGWRWWWNNRRLCKLLQDGVCTPHAYRLFDGRPGARPKWDGAEAAIYEANGLTR